MEEQPDKADSAPVEAVDGIGFVFEAWLDTQMFTDHSAKTFVYHLDAQVSDQSAFLTHSNNSLHIMQDTFRHTTENDDTGAVVWDDAVVLGKYFEKVVAQENTFFKNKTVIDLGAGTGFLGMLCAVLGAKVSITDRANRIGQLEQNIRRNHLSKEHVIASLYDWEHAGEQIKDIQTTWNKVHQTALPGFDIIIVSGCIYHEEVVTELIQAILLASTLDTVIYLAVDYRFDVVSSDPEYTSPVIQRFFELAPLHFTVVDRQALHPDFDKNSVVIYQCTIKPS